MRYVLYAAGLLVLAEATGACSSAGSFQRSSPMLDESQTKKVSAEHEGKIPHKETKMKAERFFVGEEMHHGYYLLPVGATVNREGTSDDLIFPEFTTQQVITAFEEFFSVRNNKARIGKTSYCDCVGVRYESESGVKKFKIHEAHLFSE